jgi:hypothetical protein
MFRLNVSALRSVLRFPVYFDEVGLPIEVVRKLLHLHCKPLAASAFRKLAAPSGAPSQPRSRF